ncbi:MAG: hypothetical protein WBN04_08060, partial [Paracoccaceae bacterium]
SFAAAGRHGISAPAQNADMRDIAVTEVLTPSFANMRRLKVSTVRSVTCIWAAISFSVAPVVIIFSVSASRGDRPRKRAASVASRDVV